MAHTKALRGGVSGLRPMIWAGQERQRKVPEPAARQPGSAWVPLTEDPVDPSFVGKCGSPGVTLGPLNPGAVMAKKSTRTKGSR
jgi:hypothetical protein